MNDSNTAPFILLVVALIFYNYNNQQRQTPSQQPKALGQPLRNQGDKQVQQGGAEKKAPSRALQMARARAEAKKKLAASKKASE